MPRATNYYKVGSLAVLFIAAILLPLMSSNIRRINLLPINSFHGLVSPPGYLEQENPTCSNSIFGQYYRDFDYFPGIGNWTSVDHRDPNSTFNLKLCRFQEKDISQANLEQCIKDKKLGNVVVLGDSNGFMHFPLLIHFISKVYANNCWMTKLENMTSYSMHGKQISGRMTAADGVLDMQQWFFHYQDYGISQEVLVEIRGIFQEFLQYITDDGRMENDHRKRQFLNRKDYFTDCDEELKSRMEVSSERIYCGCPSVQIQCQHPRGMLDDIRLEFIPMPEIQTSWITLAKLTTKRKLKSSPPGLKRTAPWISGEAATTYQQYIFQNYLHQQENMTFFVFLPGKHIKLTGNAENRISYFVSLLKKHISSESQVYIIPDFGEREAVKPKRFRNVKYDGLLATAMVDRINHHFFRAIKESLLLTKDKQFHGFIDLFQMGEPVNDWSLDGAHKFSRWYQVVMSYLLQLTCN